jgi:predicted Fe-Mo cluster-binding NifX family protein
MVIAFPTQENKGLGSKVFGHFGSANFFILIEDEKNEIRALENQDLFHQHGHCNPLKALGNNRVDAVVVGGIGKGALNKLSASNVKVYRAVEGSVRENLELIENAKLPLFSMDHCCSGHAGGGGCMH